MKVVNSKHMKPKQSGFTLIEVMVVLLIIGIMASMIAPQILGSQEEAQLKKAAVDIQSLESALEMYKLKNELRRNSKRVSPDLHQNMLWLQRPSTQ